MITIIPHRSDHALTPQCWCRPFTRAYGKDLLIVHNDTLGLALGTHPVSIEPRKPLP